MRGNLFLFNSKNILWCCLTYEQSKDCRLENLHLAPLIYHKHSTDTCKSYLGIYTSIPRLNLNLITIISSVQIIINFTCRILIELKQFNTGYTGAILSLFVSSGHLDDMRIPNLVTILENCESRNICRSRK